ncbi:DUF1090 family protein [Cobetia sp. 3AK]|nr:DUF1090 family protein [Cobetia sp. 3AK]MDH2373550.1 DUF1090 family protein [Cobetia sp. 3AK]
MAVSELVTVLLACLLLAITVLVGRDPPTQEKIMSRDATLGRAIALPLIAMGLSALASSVSAASPELVSGCQDKADSIKQELEDANAQGNAHKVEGLKKALAAVENGCDESTLHKEREQKIREREEEVGERRQELEDALSDGDKDKIEKKEKKLTEAQKALSEARGELAGDGSL